MNSQRGVEFRLRAPKGSAATYVLNYDECPRVVDGMRFGNESDLFGVEKDESFRSSIGDIYQTFDGKDVYPSLQEKAANLLYFVVKNHSFLDGNKRIAATMFLYFLDRNGALFKAGRKRIDNSTLVTIDPGSFVMVDCHAKGNNAATAIPASEVIKQPPFEADWAMGRVGVGHHVVSGSFQERVVDHETPTLYQDCRSDDGRLRRDDVLGGLELSR